MALFSSNIDEFRRLVPGITVNFNLEDAMPEIQAAQEAILPKFLGDTIADQLEAMGNTQISTDPTDRYLERAFYLAQVGIGRIGFANYLPFAEVQIGNDGVTITNASDRKAAFEYQTKKVQKRLLEEGWRSIDELITLVASKASLFPAWPASPYYAEHTEAIFKTPAEFSYYYPIQDRWLTFWALRPFIRGVEESQGEDAQTRIDALPDNVTDGQKARIRKDLLRPLAYQAVLDALPHLSIELNGANVQVNYASQFGNAEYYEPPGKDHLSWVMDNLTRQLALAWSTFDTGMKALETPTQATQTTDTGVIYSSGAITML
jgi:hypothetical protein